jgi:hypothetical protein
LFASFIVTALCVTSVGSALAKNGDGESVKERPAIVKIADNIIKSSRTPEEDVERLQKAGWVLEMQVRTRLSLNWQIKKM